MKLGNVSIANLQDLQKEGLILCSLVNKDEDESVTLEKKLINTTSIASKGEIAVVLEQNAKLVGILQKLSDRIGQVEEKINNLNLSQSLNFDIDDINNQIQKLAEKIDNNIIEV